MRWVLALLVFAATAALSHLAVVHLIPSRIMSTAMERMAERGVPLHAWAASPRMTPQTQTVVRPSPDLSYAICRFDTSDGPVLITAPPWDRYGSLSVFDRRTDNVHVVSLDGGEAAVLLLSPQQKGFQAASLPERTKTVFVDGKGLALIRRLAPDQTSHEGAAALVPQSSCGQLAFP